MQIRSNMPKLFGKTKLPALGMVKKARSATKKFSQKTTETMVSKDIKMPKRFSAITSRKKRF